MTVMLSPSRGGETSTATLGDTGGRTGVSLWAGDGGRTSMVHASCFLVLLLFGFSVIRHGGEVGVLEQLPVSGRIYIFLNTHIIKDRWSPWKQACASNHRDT